MKDAIDLIKQFKPVGITRDIHYAVTGIFFLLALDFLFKPNPNLYLHWFQLASIYKFGIVVIVGYFFARFCYEIGIFIHEAIGFCLVKDKKLKFKESWKSLEDYFNEVPVEITPSELINYGELEEFIFETKSSLIFYERKVQSLITESMFLGFSIILSIFYSPYFVFALVAILFISIKSSVELSQLRVEMALFLTKKTKNSENSD